MHLSRTPAPYCPEGNISGRYAVILARPPPCIHAFPRASPHTLGVGAEYVTHVMAWASQKDGQPYTNTYAWFMRFEEKMVVEATAFFDSLAFNELWQRVDQETVEAAASRTSTCLWPPLDRQSDR